MLTMSWHDVRIGPNIVTLWMVNTAVVQPTVEKVTEALKTERYTMASPELYAAFATQHAEVKERYWVHHPNECHDGQKNSQHLFLCTLQPREVTEDELYRVTRSSLERESIYNDFHLKRMCINLGITVDPNYVHQKKIMIDRILELVGFKLSLIEQRRNLSRA